MQRYTLDKELGRGSFGVVSLGKDKTSGDSVVIKTIDSKVAADKPSQAQKVLDFALQEAEVFWSLHSRFS